MTVLVNITHEREEDTRQKTICKPKSYDEAKIVKYLKKHFGESVNFDKKTKILYLCDNEILKTEEFLVFITQWKVYIQPSLF